MKEQPTKQKRAKPGFDETRFISEAKTILADTPGAKGRKSKKHPAVGYQRVTFDIEMTLHEALDREAFDTKRKRRQIIEDMLRERYTAAKNQKYLSV